MRVLRPMFYSAVAISILTACSSVSKVAVPTGSNNIVNISAKKAALTDYEKDNWLHLDLATDSIPGMSVNKAYDFLKGKKNVTVVVGVVDSGTDLKHEDLASVAWVNTNEIAGNGIDDDKNGYIDDINGWNFLGESYKEHLEYERILMNPSLVDATTLAEVKKQHAEKIAGAKKSKVRSAEFVKMSVESEKALTKYFGKSTYTKKEIAAINSSDESLNRAKGFAARMLSYFSDLKETKEYFEKGIKNADKTIAEDNLKTDYRKVVGDNPYDINDKPGYGNANTGHSEKKESHGTHVTGIIGAVRNNNIGTNGVADNVKMMAVRSVSDGDEYDKDVALGIRYAVDNGAKVINTSFGKDFSPNKEWVYDALKYAAKKDVLIVNAAGNSGKNIDVEKTFPNDAPDLINEISDNVLTLGAMSSNYNKELPASFSNYGKKNVDVFAPGVQINSTYPDNTYKKISGTSMASPAAAGVAALVRSYYPELSASQVKHILMNSGTKIDLLVTKPGSKTSQNPQGDLVPFADLSVSGRVVNAYNAVKMADRMVNGKK
ncbi:S8 family serine peptidase [Tenacibaculum dicentrarchi]|nr:S8 family serine peptidase [Tenacibaculum dicentrarchi]MCD8413980.1 S8 family serine peptidase [Tenacibaculum dicentrarchi]MCD8419382.1 S8 family serine peptidase [Tenacibaculum dicentrarchi]MCD8424395.1 S8 family serine peptidase [Tenacibaculum dicentrarchi]MCD8436283.1 S8 family serine peptidase [Tenacibaculum dicentrarchi]